MVSIVGVVLTGKDNYSEWLRKIKHIFIFNDLWVGICEGEGDVAPEELTLGKELAKWKSKEKKAYVLIASTVTKEVSLHILCLELL